MTPFRRAKRLGGALASFLAIALAGQAAAADYEFGAEPAWVDTIDLAVDDARKGVDGLDYRLVDDQVHFGPDFVSYRRWNYRITESKGAESGGSFRIRFSPVYQHVVLHRVDLTRDGTRRDIRSTLRIESMRREERLDDGLIDGYSTLSAVIPDVRSGDALDIAYSVRGANPIFGGRNDAELDARFSVGLVQRRVRFVAPVEQPLAHRVTLDGFTRTERVSGNVRIVDYRTNDPPRTRVDSEAPSWFDPYGSIVASNYNSWSDVAAWAKPIYAQRDAPDDAVRRAVAGLGKLEAGSMAATLAAVAFVQEHVRYTGIEIGESSHAPSAPAAVLQRRYGDCKDKAVLLVALLKELGVRAEPALVSARLRNHVDEHLPGPRVFDHVIVRAHVGGATYWFDPTREVETASFDARAPIGFRRALPIVDNAELVDIPITEAKLPDVDVTQIIDMREATVESGAAQFDISTTYRRGQIGALRNQLAGKTDEVAAHYLDYFRRELPDIERVGEIEVDDQRDSLLTTETYRLPHAWTATGDRERFDITLFQLRDYLPLPEVRDRVAPLQLSSPRFAVHDVRVLLDAGWNIDRSTDTVANEFFEFERSVYVKDDVLHLDAKLRRLTDHVPADRMKEYLVDLAAARDLAHYQLTRGTETADIATLAAPRVWLLPMLALLLAFATALLAFLFRDKHWTAGLLIRPRVTSGALADSTGGRRTALLIIALSAVVAATFSDAPWSTTDPVRMGIFWVAAGVGHWIGVALLQAGLVAIALVILGSRRAFAGAQQGLGFGQVPFIVFGALAILAFGERLPMLTREGWDAQIHDLPALLAGILLILSGVLWTLVNTVGALSGAARVTLGRAILGLLAPTVVVTLLIVAVAVLRQ